MTIRFSLVVQILSGIIALSLPLIVSAQAAQQDDLHAAIWSSLLADPRTAHILPAEMQQLVDALAAQAQAQHLTAADILWRPTSQQPAPSVAETAQGAQCAAGFSGFLCKINQSFGFGSNDLIIPGFLFASSGLLAVVIRRMRINAKARMAAQAAAPPWSEPM